MQKINLLHPDFIPKPVPFRAAQLAMSLPISMVLVALLSVYVWREESLAIHERDQQQQILQTEQTTLIALGGRLQGRQPDDQQLAGLRDQLSYKQQLVQALGEKAQRDTRGFAEFLQGLSAAGDDALWLTHFSATPSDFSAQGESPRADTIPVWLQRLKQQPALRNRPVTGLVIHEPDTQNSRYRYAVNAPLAAGHTANTGTGTDAAGGQP